MNAGLLLASARVRAGALVVAGGLGRASLLTAIGSGAARVVGLPAALIGAATLGSQQYGYFAILVTTAALLTSFGSLGVAPTITPAIAASLTPARRAVLATAALSIVVGLLVLWCLAFLVVVNVVDLGQWFRDNRLFRGTGGIAVVLWAVGSGVSGIVSAVLTGHKEFGLASKLVLFRAVVVGYATLALAIGSGSAILSALAAGCAETFVAVLGVLLLARRRWCATGRVRQLARLAATVGRGAVPAGLANLLIQASGSLTQFLLVSTQNGAADNGGFALASRLSIFVSFLPAALGASAVAYIAGHPDRRRAHALGVRTLQVGMVLSLAASVLLWGFASRAATVFGPSYAPYASTIAIMAIAGIAVSANGLLSNVALGLFRIGAWVVSDVVLAVVLALAAVILVQRYGAPGAAMATAIGYGASAAFLAIRLFRRPADRVVPAADEVVVGAARPPARVSE